MKILTTPTFAAAAAVALALALHPLVGASRIAVVVVPAAALLLAIGLLARASSSRPALVLALGAVVSLTGLAFDALRGVSGSLELAPGEAAARFTELGADGRPGGLRPLGFSLRLDTESAPGVLDLTAQGPTGSAPLRIASDRAAAFGGMRIGRPEWHSAAGSVTALRIGISRGDTTQEVLVEDGAAVSAGDLEIGLERYFPDFALDANRQPFSRSQEPRNPGALLHVKRGAAEFRVFVLKALPGIHKQEGLDAAFALVDVETPRVVALAVTSEPAAPAVAAGLALVFAGLLLGARPRDSEAAATAGAAALALTAVLLAVDGGRVLRWGFGTSGSVGRVELAGVGLVLGAALVAALAAFLWLAIAADSGTAPALSRGRSVLVLAAGLALLGLALGIVRMQSLAEAMRPASFRPLVAVGLGAFAAACGAHRLLKARGWGDAVLATVVTYAPSALALVVLVLGALAWQRGGAYDAPRVAAAAAAALLARAASEPTRGAPALSALAVIAVAWLIAS